MYAPASWRLMVECLELWEVGARSGLRRCTPPPFPHPPPHQMWTAGSPEGFFSHIFIDEAGHAEEPLLLCALAGHAKRDGSTRVVLAGGMMDEGQFWGWYCI